MANVFPLTKGQIVAELNNIETLIKNILDDPTKFTEITGGTVKIDMDKYIKLLMERQKELQNRLRKFPYWTGIDVEGTI